MTPELWVALAVAAIGAISGIASAILAMANHTKLTTLEVSINGRLSQLLAVSNAAAHAEGITAGSLDRAAVETVIAQAITQAVAMAPPSTAPTDTVLATDTNQRVKNIQDDAAAVAAALIVKNSAAIAAALIIKTAEDAAARATHPEAPHVHD